MKKAQKHWRVSAIEKHLKGRSAVDVEGEKGTVLYLCRHEDTQIRFASFDRDYPEKPFQEVTLGIKTGEYLKFLVVDHQAKTGDNYVLNEGNIRQIDLMLWDLSEGREISQSTMKAFEHQWKQGEVVCSTPPER